MEISKDELKLVKSYIGKLQDILSQCGNPEHYLDSDELEELDKDYSSVCNLFNRLLSDDTNRKDLKKDIEQLGFSIHS